MTIGVVWELYQLINETFVTTQYYKNPDKVKRDVNGVNQTYRGLQPKLASFGMNNKYKKINLAN